MREEVIRVLLEIAVIPRQVSKCLLEIPLIQLADIPLLIPAATNITLDGWMAKALASDKQLGIIRDRIPFAAVYIPDTPRSADFFNLALAIGETPKPQVAPENHNQACWIKTNQYYWNATVRLHIASTDLRKVSRSLIRFIPYTVNRLPCVRFISAGVRPELSSNILREGFCPYLWRKQALDYHKCASN